MKKLLITGFTPFGGEQINPSWEAVSRLPDRVGDFALTRMRIPVTFGEAAAQVIAAARSMTPDVIISVGQAAGRSAVTPEFVAINLRHANIPDNAGNRPLDLPVIAGGPAAYLSAVWWEPSQPQGLPPLHPTAPAPLSAMMFFIRSRHTLRGAKHRLDLFTSPICPNRRGERSLLCRWLQCVPRSVPPSKRSIPYDHRHTNTPLSCVFCPRP